MNRYRAYWPIDDAPWVDGDAGWVGVNMIEHPSRLQSGYVAYAENARFEGGRVRTRPGITVLSWSNRSGLGLAPDRIESFGKVHGAAVFADVERGFDWILVASEDDRGRLVVWRARPGNGSARVSLPEVEAGPVEMVQTFDGMVMLRGAGKVPLWMTDLDLGFRERPVPDTTQYSALPESTTGIYFQNRLLVVTAGEDPANRDTVWVSDVGATMATLRGAAEWWNHFRIDPGTADRLVTVYPLTETSVVVLKEGSVHLLTNLVGTSAQISQNAVLQTVTTEYGAVSNRAVVQVGRDVWFLANRRGICSVALTEQGKVQAVDLPVSWPIDELIRRIHWPAASGSVAVFHANRVYWAVPLDGSPVNNAVLIYDAVNRAWSGMDRGEAVRVTRWLKARWNGEEQLFFVNPEGVIGWYESGEWDQVLSPDGTVECREIGFRVRSRGYHAQPAGRKQFGKLRVMFSTWWPQIQVRTRNEKIGSDEILRDRVERSNRRWLKAGRTERAVDNRDDDQGQAGLEDYAVELPVWVGSGLDLMRFQEWQAEWPVRRLGEYLQVEVEGTRGQITLLQMELESHRGGVVFGKS